MSAAYTRLCTLTICLLDEHNKWTVRDLQIQWQPRLPTLTHFNFSLSIYFLYERHSNADAWEHIITAVKDLFL
jgi:hypothetical protein